MSFTFSDEDIDRIATVLAVPAKREDGTIRFTLSDEASGRSLALEIKNDLALPEDLGQQRPVNLVSVYAASSFLQLQRCTGYIASKELGEVIFVAKQAGATNGLVIEREAGCSLFANVDTRLLTTDFTRLPPEMIMSSVALSLTETLFDDLG